MTDANDEHEKIRFSRKDRHDLDLLPSASKRHTAAARGARLLRRITKFFFWSIAAISVAFIAAIGWLAVFGFSNSYFSRTTENLIQSVAGSNVETGLESAKLSLDKSGNLAFQGNNLTIRGSGQTSMSGSADEIRIGLKSKALIGGVLDIGVFEADGVQLQLPAADGWKVFDRFKTAGGQYSPANIPLDVALLVEQFRKQLSLRNADVIILKDVIFSRGGSGSTLPAFKTLTIASKENGAFSISGAATFSGQNVSIEGTISAADQYDFIMSGLSFGTAPLTGELVTAKFRSGASGNIRITGDHLLGKRRIVVENRIGEFAWTSRKDVRFAGDAVVRLELVEGVEKVEIQPSSIKMGLNKIEFSGAVGPSPSSDAANVGQYRFEIVSNDSKLQPSDSPERRLDLAFQLSGTVEPDAKTVRFAQMAARTLGGDAFGQGTMRFLGGTPEMIFGLRIPNMKISDAKQLWPAMIASSARKWVLEHVYGGTITDSKIDVTFKAGFFDALPTGVVRDPINPDQFSGDFNVRNARVDLIGDLPPVRDAIGRVEVRGSDTVVTISKGTAYLEDGSTAEASNGTLSIPFVPGKPVVGILSIDVAGEVQTIASLADREPINAMDKAPVSASDLSGNAVAHINATFPLRKSDGTPSTVWKAAVDFTGLSIAKDFDGQKLSDADGRLEVDQQVATFTANGKLNDIPAEISLTEPIGGSGAKRDLSAKLKLDEKARAALMPGLGDMLKGTASVEVTGSSGAQVIKADLKNATLNLPWAGWSKGNGVPAIATFKLSKNGDSTSIDDFKLEGGTFRFIGSMDMAGGKLSKANFSSVRLNRGDNAAVSIQRSKDGYDISVNADSLDLRSLLKKVLNSFESAAKAAGSDTIRVNATIGSATGFGSETLQNVKASYVGRGANVISFNANAKTNGGGSVKVENGTENGRRTVNIQTGDGGSLLRFFDYYDKMSGGQISVALSSSGDGPLGGEIDARNFTIVGEPRLKSLVGTPVTPDGQSVAKAAKNKIDVTRVKFQRGYSVIQKGDGYLRLGKGILRSDQIGLSYEGTLYDRDGRINMTGTFLPAFGLNRLFGDIPIIGDILGNGRDNGLIGITFKLSGPAKSPKLSINPLSLVAPGIFRQIFEFQ